MTPLLTVRNLRVVYPGDQGETVAVRDVSFALGRERLGIVGESGSGKSTTGRAIMGLVARPGRVTADELRLGELDLRRLGQRGFRRIRGSHVAMILQDPKFALNPVMTVGEQIAEAHRAHHGGGDRAAREAALAMLASVHIDDPRRVYDLYPHEVSGGMGQRAMIAMMLIGGPELLIADEPTSALDVTVQAQVLAVLDEQVRRRGMGLILISHNLHLVARFCDRVLVMYAGRVLEEIAARRLAEARHPYTRGLLAALPELRRRRPELPQLRRDPAWLDPGMIASPDKPALPEWERAAG
jgi:peptide/nickel transport system ATP-binding protein